MSRGILPFSAPVWLLILAGLAPGAPPSGKPSPSEELLRFNNLGIAYLAQYKPAEAEKQFRQALAVDPSYVVGHVNLGIAALAQAHHDEAIASFRKALSVDKDNIYARFNLSQILKLQGKMAEALPEGLEALRLDSRDADLRYHVGSLYMNLRDTDKAIEQFEMVVRLDANFLSAYYSLGRAYLAKGNLEKGKRFMEKHRELQAGVGATPAVGLKYGEQGRYSYAMEDAGPGGPTVPLAEGDVVFVDVTTGSGIEFEHRATGGIDELRRATGGAGSPGAPGATLGPLLGAGLAMADLNGDGLEDLFFVNAGAGKVEPALYLNQGAMRFERVSGAGAPAVAGSAMSAAFGDLDGDADPDLVLGLQQRIAVLVNDGKGLFTDASAAAGLAERAADGLLGGVSLADVDHDGDLDVFVAGFLAPAPATAKFPASWPGQANMLFINATGPAGPDGSAPAVKLVESAQRARVALPGRRMVGAVFSDLDNDRDIDIALASPGDGTTVLSNMRDGTFSDMGAACGLPAAALVMGLAVGDYNKDGWMDLAATTWDGGLPRFFRNAMGDPQRPGAGRSAGAGAFVADVSAVADLPRQAALPQFGVAFLDFDNDGHQDLITANGDRIGQAIFVYRNDGSGRFTDASGLTGARNLKAHGGRGLAAGDLDADGDLDLVVSNAGGRPTLLRNDGGNKNHWIRIAPAGLHSNKPAVGTKVEIKSGRLWQKIEVAAGSGYLSQGSLVAHFGLGDRSRVDVVRLLWPGGVLQDEVQVKADAIFAVRELDRKGSSCPILYAWNGRQIAFVSDFLGGSAIGYRTGPASFNYPDTDEYVKISAQQLQPRSGRLELRMVNQLEETIYFDRARLLAVDHPSDVEVFPDERLMPAPPYPRFRLFAVSDARPPAAAHGDAGEDLLDAVSRIDRLYAGPAEARPLGTQAAARSLKGYASEHRLTLDLGPVPRGEPLVLLLHGWIDYADSTSNLAAAQAGLRLVPPYLEALDESDPAAGETVDLGTGPARRGRWVRALPQIGFPAGLPKTMTVDLAGALPPGSSVVRIGTSMRIFWDQVQVATQGGPGPRVTPVEAAQAVLGYRGFPALSSPDGRAPEAYDYGREQEPVHWKSHVGAFTRYGDVTPLLASVDDRYVITRPGDEIALEFPADLPPLPEGWTRDYLLYADGFGKDMDLNSARPHTVSPLPYHAMSSYPPPAGEGFPYQDTAMMDYLDHYATRLVTSPLAPINNPPPALDASSSRP